ncbi:hypothetical protein HM1_1538 [Heliomicrobium modesticaldum Ice1]|uniref:Uncharacterized protein n=1 Tax=Heliobacterium modesticaldum (strain ATCC 51547 / Ice1) TaxID=498761 RepID=B0TD69_HELMI|nr:hypothetical protein HM1_1538 [Heliomicrobium modesticaldum Ice1]
MIHLKQYSCLAPLGMTAKRNENQKKGKSDRRRESRLVAASFL